MSTINVQCTDQVLAITNSPVIASGGMNENYIQFSFCSKWDGFAKICVFYRQGESYYYSLIDSTDKCKIPDECLVSSGKINFGVVGVGATDNSLRRTSEILTYKVVAGVITEISDPTPEIYQQILSELAKIQYDIEHSIVPDESITTGKVADGAITLAKINSNAFDNAPTASSNKLLTSGTIQQALSNLATKTHAAQHAANGSDPVSPASIGAVPRILDSTMYGDTLPTDDYTAGRLFFKKVT